MTDNLTVEKSLRSAAMQREKPAAPLSRNDGLDAIRLLAALMVFAAHAALASGMTGPVLELGAWGVALFFGLSGYLIPTVWLRDPTPRYFLRRAARIMPAYWFAVIGLGLATGVPITLRDLTMTQAFDTGQFDRFMGVAWTLQLEIVFYALVPLLMRLRPASIAMLGAASLALSILTPGQPGWFLERFWMFVPGMLLVGRKLPEVRMPRVIVYGSTISYGIYLWHHEILRWLRDVDGPVVLGGLVLTLLAAAVSWRFVERPFLRSAPKLDREQFDDVRRRAGVLGRRLELHRVLPGRRYRPAGD